MPIFSKVATYQKPSSNIKGYLTPFFSRIDGTNFNLQVFLGFVEYELNVSLFYLFRQF